MKKRYVIEAVMLAIYGELSTPVEPVEYIIPASTIYELDEIVRGPEPIMPVPEEDQHVRHMIRKLIEFFQDPFRKKKMEKSLIAPWSTVTFPVDDEIQLTVIKAEDNAYWGELFDPIETELMLTAMYCKVPLLTDQIEWEERMIEHGVQVQFYDIGDFSFAMEGGIMPDDLY